MNYQITTVNSPTSFAAVGLPSGLSVNASTGLISGTPTTPGTSTVTLKAVNASGSTSAILTMIIGSGGLPLPWQSQDIGAVGISGATSYLGGTFTVAGSGADIWGTADAFQYVYQQISGDCSITARVASVQDTDTNAKAAVMIRSDLTAGSAHAMLDVSPGGGIEFIYRTTENGDASRGAIGGAAPYWVRLTRAGNNFTSYASPDGTNWTQVGSQTINMGSTIYIGMPVCSHVAGSLCTGTFDHVTVTGLPVITGKTSVSASDGTAFSYQIIASSSAISYGASGLPSGLQINTATGLISGTPAVAGSFPVTISATSAAGTTTTTLTLTLVAALTASDTPTIPQWGLMVLALLLVSAAVAEVRLLR